MVQKEDAAVSGAGLAGAEFEVFKAVEDGENYVLNRDDANQDYFAAPGMGMSDAYLWSHHGEDVENGHAENGIVQGDAALKTLKVNEKGILVLEGMHAASPHYLVETKAPDGYYAPQGGAPVLFEANASAVTYTRIENVSRAVKPYQGKFLRRPRGRWRAVQTVQARC